jgi:hypothetical protein
MIYKTSKINYDGSLIHKRFGYEFYRKEYNPSGVVVVFRGNMDVTTNLIDLEDKINDDYIYSDDAINVCWEIPSMSPLGAVFFQRLFINYVAQSIQQMCGFFDIKVDGDDIMIKKDQGDEFKKASVSITKVVDGDIALGHLGLNIIAGEQAPSFAFSLGLNEIQVEKLSQKINDMFYDTLKDCFIATTKVVI